MATDPAIEQELAELDRQASSGGNSTFGSGGGMNDFDLTGFDISDVDPSRRSFSLIPENTFIPVVITRSSGKMSSNGKAMLDMEYTAFAGEYNTRKVWDNIMLDGNRNRYVHLLSAVGLYDETNKRALIRSSRELLGRKLWIKTIIEKGTQKPNSTEMYPDRNRPAPWDGFYAINTFPIPGEETLEELPGEFPDPFAAKPSALATVTPEKEAEATRYFNPINEAEPETVVSEGVTTAGPVQTETKLPAEIEEVGKPEEVLEEAALEEPEEHEPSEQMTYDGVKNSVPDELQQMGYESAPVDGDDGPAVDVLGETSADDDEEMRRMEEELERKRQERKASKTKPAPALAGATGKGSAATAERPEEWS